MRNYFEPPQKIPTRVRGHAAEPLHDGGLLHGQLQIIATDVLNEFAGRDVHRGRHEIDIIKDDLRALVEDVTEPLIAAFLFAPEINVHEKFPLRAVPMLGDPLRDAAPDAFG